MATDRIRSSVQDVEAAGIAEDHDLVSGLAQSKSGSPMNPRLFTILAIAQVLDAELSELLPDVPDLLADRRHWWQGVPLNPVLPSAVFAISLDVAPSHVTPSWGSAASIRATAYEARVKTSQRWRPSGPQSQLERPMPEHVLSEST